MEKKVRNQIFKEVKERISTGNYDEIHRLRSIESSDKIITLGNKRLSEKDIFSYYEKVVDIIECEDGELTALGQLIENEVFENLNSTDRERYVLDLSRLYLDLKKEYFNRL